MVRRVFFDNPECDSTTYVVQIPNVAALYARRTRRLHQQQTETGFVVCFCQSKNGSPANFVN